MSTLPQSVTVVHGFPQIYTQPAANAYPVPRLAPAYGVRTVVSKGLQVL